MRCEAVSVGAVSRQCSRDQGHEPPHDCGYSFRDAKCPVCRSPRITTWVHTWDTLVNGFGDYGCYDCGHKWRAVVPPEASAA